MSYSPAKITIDLAEYEELQIIKNKKEADHPASVFLDFLKVLGNRNGFDLRTIKNYNLDSDGKYTIILSANTSGPSIQIVKK